ncbi:unnamed protein product [Prunus armeniaca]
MIVLVHLLHPPPIQDFLLAVPLVVFFTDFPSLCMLLQRLPTTLGIKDWVIPPPKSSIKYYVLFVDDCTKFRWFYPIKTKSAVFQTFLHFKSHVEKLLSLYVKALQSDSGGEFLSTAFVTYLKDNGINHQLSCPHTPQKNECAKRKHRHLVETVRTLLSASKVPHQFWVEAFTTAIYLINRIPISSKTISPLELFLKRKSDYSQLRVFGYACYPWLKPYTSSKLDPKSTKCAFLDFPFHTLPLVSSHLPTSSSASPSSLIYFVLFSPLSTSLPPQSATTQFVYPAAASIHAVPPSHQFNPLT